jgi:hypothetical protein
MLNAGTVYSKFSSEDRSVCSAHWLQWKEFYPQGEGSEMAMQEMDMAAFFQMQAAGRIEESMRVASCRN